MTRSILLAVAATVGIAFTTQAQQPADSADVLVFSGAFTTATGEFVRVFLQKGQVYRAEISVGSVSFSLRPRRAGGEMPSTVQLRGGPGSGESVYEIYPYRDDEYEVRVADFPEGETATLKIYRDIVASRRRQGIAKAPGSHWYLGLEVGYGHHGSYQISVVENDPDRSGSDLEGCVTLRPSTSRFSLCVLGVTRHSGKRAVDVLWIYTEPRFTVIQGHGISHPEIGVSLRAAFGSNQDTGNPPFFVDTGANPALVGFGGFVKIWPLGAPGGGISAALSVQHMFLLGIQDINPSFDAIGVTIGFAF